jgi:hypothetical protein
MDTFNFTSLSPASSGAFLFDQQPAFQPSFNRCRSWKTFQMFQKAIQA